MSSMTQKLGNSQSAEAKAPNTSMPKQGDHFRCEKCGMEIEVTTACRCSDPNHVQFQCCGQAMAKT
jgi:hypothetical protein